jgi:hypothetical protein
MEEDAEGDACLGVIEACAEGLACFVVDRDEIALSGIGGGLPDHGGVDGGVVAEGLELDPRVAPGGFIDWRAWSWGWGWGSMLGLALHRGRLNQRSVMWQSLWWDHWACSGG